MGQLPVVRDILARRGCGDSITSLSRRYSVQVQYDSDIPLLGIFLLTSFVITGLVRRLQQSTATARRQAQLLDLTHDTVIARDSNDAITFWNRGAEQLYGWSREKPSGRCRMGC